MTYPELGFGADENWYLNTQFEKKSLMFKLENKFYGNTYSYEVSAFSPFMILHFFIFKKRDEWAVLEKYYVYEKTKFSLSGTYKIWNEFENYKFDTSVDFICNRLRLTSY